MKIIKLGSLQIEPEAKHLNSTFLFIQKISFILMAITLLVSFLGLLGNGMFSAISKTEKNITVSYEKFLHKQGITTYTIAINSPVNNNRLKFWIDPSFYKKLIIKNINPTPTKEEIINNKIYYSFDTNNTNIINIKFIVEPEGWGVLTTQMGLPEGGPIYLTQLIYP